MSVEENKAIARRLVEEGWANPDILDQIMAPDVVASGEMRGLEAYKQQCRAAFAGIPDMHLTVDGIIAEEDQVVVHWTASGTHTGDWMGLAPTNKRAKWSGADTLRIVDAKIVEDRQLWQAISFYQQLGLIPPWEEFIKLANAKQK